MDSDVGQEILDLIEPPRLQKAILDGLGPRIAHIADFLGLPANTIEPGRILGIASWNWHYVDSQAVVLGCLLYHSIANPRRFADFQTQQASICTTASLRNVCDRGRRRLWGNTMELLLI